MNKIIKNSAIVGGKPPSYRELDRINKVLEERLIEQQQKLAESEAKGHDLIHLLLKLYTSKCPDICEYFIDCSIRNQNCIEKDNPLRLACKTAKQWAS